MSTTADVDARLVGFCSCGLEMVPTKPGSDFLHCLNCDVVQDVEVQGGKRVATGRDYTFTKVWRQRILRLYPGQG
jgi:hypothetical protein